MNLKKAIQSLRSPEHAKLAVALGLASVAFGCAEPGDESSIEGAAASIESAADATTSGSGSLEVRGEFGTVRGALVGATRQFLGIPYAKAPVGALRFAPPVAASEWSGVRDATAFGPSCVQNPGALAAPGPQSEDCLTLNVYSPTGVGNKLPVMVFIHGGAFVAGGSVQYDGKKLAEEGKVVVVTLNYRLGALGLLSHPQLDAERGRLSGNNALRDQELALTWVRKYIEDFNGLSDRITVFGESAGAWSTCLNLVSPITRTQAGYIMQSGTCVAGLTLHTQQNAQALSGAMAAELCAEQTDAVACLRSKPAAEIVAWRANVPITGAGFAPVLGDDFLPAHPVDLLARSPKRTEVIAGSNAREWGLFQAARLSPVQTTVAQYHATIDATFGPALAPALKAVYAAPTDADANPQFVKLMSDYLFRCPARALVRQATATGQIKAYLYHFEEGPAYHAFELPYVFGNPSLTLGTPTEPLRKYIQTYWAKFAYNGNPNANGQPSWPLYTAAGDQHLSLKAAPVAGTGLSKPQCDFWASLPRP